MSKNFVDYSNAEDLMEGVQSALESRKKTWGPGHQADWNSLTLEQKLQYERADIDDDDASGDVDNVPTENSPNLVTSGGVYSALSTKANSADLGTAAGKDYTTNVSPNNRSLVESNAVYSAINNALSSVYTPRGSITCAELVSSLLIPANVGNVYNTTDSGTTTADFMQGAGVNINAGDSVGIIQTGPSIYKFNLMGNTIDLHEYQKQTLTTPITVDGVQKTTVEDTLGALNDFGEDERGMRYLYNCKNLLTAMTSPHTSRDVVFTPNDKGEITCSGSVSTTPSYIHAIPIDQSALVVGEKYILSGLPSDSTNCYIKIYQSDGYVEISGATKARMITYDGTNIKSWDCGVRTVGTDATGRVFKPMLCLKSDYDNDPTYAPPANTNQYLSAKKADWSAVNALYNDVSGTKNILENVGANSTTIRNVLFTKNSDGSVTVSGTQDGTGGGSYYHVSDYIYGDGKKYILTGCPAGGSRTTYRVYLYDNTTGSTGEVATDSGSGSSATLTKGHTYICNIHIGASQSVSDLTFYPMLRLASIQDDTYVPYAENNRTLTTKINGEIETRVAAGAHNYASFDMPMSNAGNMTWTKTSTGVRVTNSTSATYRYCQFALFLEKNTDYIVSTKITATSGTGGIVVKGDNTDGLLTAGGITGNVSYTFNSGNHSTWYFAVYSTFGTAAIGDVLYENFLIRRASDPSTDYQPFTMTNQQLTEKVTKKISVGMTSSSIWSAVGNAIYNAIKNIDLTNVIEMKVHVYNNTSSTGLHTWWTLQSREASAGYYVFTRTYISAVDSNSITLIGLNVGNNNSQGWGMAINVSTSAISKTNFSSSVTNCDTCDIYYTTY